MAGPPAPDGSRNILPAMLFNPRRDVTDAPYSGRIEELMVLVNEERGFGGTSDIGANTGAKFEFSTRACNNEGFSGTGPFVIAYRLREVYYKKGILETKPYNKGAVLGDGMVSSQQSPDETQFVIEEARLGPSDFKRRDVKAYNFIDDEREECELLSNYLEDPGNGLRWTT
ncbi:hypothetical protein B7494_g6414 [Chlorociboria aeruginascens]|nr:hypothetical protein B7494_g6414 [Chlorociboria aeruginascens]